MGTETLGLSVHLTYILLVVVEKNNPLMGTETIISALLGVR